MVMIGALAAIILGAIFIHGEQQKKQAIVQAPAPPPLPSLALPPPPLTRSEIVQDAKAAASAYAMGAKPTLTKSPLIGRSFTVRIPFGCGGPGAASPTAQADVELDPTTSALKLTARPATWTTLPALADVPKADKIETVEGFWIPRPWMDSEACPPNRDTPLPATPTPAAAQTVGLARIFEKGGSRVLMRNDRPYQFVRRVSKDDAALLGHTYRLVLEGRLVGFGDGRAAHCWSESADHRPICLYAVEYSRVAFEDADSGETLAEWRE
jgi:hypothetical protein